MNAYLLPIAIIIVLIVINGVFVAAEFALVSSRRSRFEALAQDSDGVARWLVGVLDKPKGKDAYIAVAQLGITLASIGLGMYGEPAVAAWLYPALEGTGLSVGQSHALGFVLALGAITYLHVVFGEMIPRRWHCRCPKQSASQSTRPCAPSVSFSGR